MSQGFAVTGHINVQSLGEVTIQAIGGGLEDVLIGVQDVSVRQEGGQLHFSAYGEVCTCDDIPGELQQFAEQHGVNFMARIDENDQGYEVHFFGSDADAIQGSSSDRVGRSSPHGTR